MNIFKIFKKGIIVLIGVIKTTLLKALYRKKFDCKLINLLSVSANITIEQNAHLQADKLLKLRKNTKIILRKNAKVVIGKNFFMNENCSLISHENITVGDNVMLGPGVLIYDHDHDYTHPDGIYAMQYKTRPVTIGNNVWIGANTIILKGTIIGDNCVVAAGSVLKGTYTDNSLIYQERKICTKEIVKRI